MRWGKVRVANGGDKIRTVCAMTVAQSKISRDSSFIRVSHFQFERYTMLTFSFQYSLMVMNCRARPGEPAKIRQVFYGRLHCILDLTILRSREINPHAPKHYLLALVEPCSTQGRDATRELTRYSQTTTKIVIDIRAIECVVGRVARGGEWGIIDRSGNFMRTVFVETEDNDD